MKKIAKRLIRQIINDYESLDNFLNEYNLNKSTIESLENGDQDVYATVQSLVYGRDIEWRQMDKPVGLGYNSIMKLENGIYTIEFTNYGIKEVDKGSLNINQVECMVYMEKDYVNEFIKV